LGGSFETNKWKRTLARKLYIYLFGELVKETSDKDHKALPYIVSWALWLFKNEMTF